MDYHRSNEKCVAFEVLRGYCDDWFISGKPMKAAWDLIVTRYQHTLFDDEVLDKSVVNAHSYFRAAVTALMSMMEWNFEDIYKCCEGKRLVMDGTNVSINYQHLIGKSPKNISRLQETIGNLTRRNFFHTQKLSEAFKEPATSY